jgi:hypothetical protein
MKNVLKTGTTTSRCLDLPLGRSAGGSDGSSDPPWCRLARPGGRFPEAIQSKRLQGQVDHLLLYGTQRSRSWFSLRTTDDQRKSR